MSEPISVTLPEWLAEFVEKRSYDMQQTDEETIIEFVELATMSVIVKGEDA